MGAFGKLQAYRFGILLSRPFTEWDAFKLGLIDEKGERLKRPVTSQEKNALDVFENLVRKIKKLLIKYIPDTRFLQFLIAAYLLKNESKDDINNVMLEIIEGLKEKETEILFNVLSVMVEIEDFKTDF